MKEVIENWVKDKLKDGPVECNLDGAWFNLIKNVLENTGYSLSNSPDRLDDWNELNGWQCDYSQYIFKDQEYTGFLLYGSYYYGEHKIEKDETNRI